MTRLRDRRVSGTLLSLPPQSQNHKYIKICRILRGYIHSGPYVRALSVLLTGPSPRPGHAILDVRHRKVMKDRPLKIIPGPWFQHPPCFPVCSVGKAFLYSNPALPHDGLRDQTAQTILYSHELFLPGVLS